MSVGYELTKSLMDRRGGTLAVRLRDTLRECRDLDTWLDGVVDTELEALGYTAQEVADLKSAMGDAAQLADIFEGTVALPTAKNFRTFLGRLIGPN